MLIMVLNRLSWRDDFMLVGEASAVLVNLRLRELIRVHDFALEFTVPGFSALRVFAVAMIFIYIDMYLCIW